MSDGDRGISDLPIFNNPAVSTVVNLQRRHPGEMVFLEVAAAGALLYQHHRSKSRHEEIRAEADEELRRRGWDGGMKEHQRTNSGLLSPSAGQQYPQRPTSAPPPGYVPQGYQGVGAQQRGDPMAYGMLPPQDQAYGAPRADPMAYGSTTYQQQYQTPYGPAPEQYQQPYGPPPMQYDQQYAQPAPGQWQQPYVPPPGQYAPQYVQTAPGYQQSYGPPGPPYPS